MALEVALDAFGGDNAPKVPVKAAIFAKKTGINVILVGDKHKILSELKQNNEDASQYTIEDAPETISMEEKIDASTLKKQSSIRVCYQIVKEGKASAVVSAGHTGAMMALGKMILKTISWVDRPCVATLMPRKNGVVLLADAGANVDTEPKNLLDFAILADCYLKAVLDKPAPKIALLNIGEEEGKGDHRSREAYNLLKAAKLNFVGNIEGKEYFLSDNDAVICDGFSGNVLLKSVQGAEKFISYLIRTEVKKNPFNVARGLIFKPLLDNIKKQIDYANFGGAPLLGLNGISIVCHGSSNEKAIVSAIKLASWAHKQDFVAKMHNATDQF